MTCLESLLENIRLCDPRVLDARGDLRTDLPTFGGPTPDDTSEVWSWDKTRILIGPCASEMEIINR